MTNLTAIAKQANAYYNDMIPVYKHQPISLCDAEMLFAINCTRMAINNAANSNTPEQSVAALETAMNMVLQHQQNIDAYRMHVLAGAAWCIVWQQTNQE
jgi:hypothetical protein